MTEISPSGLINLDPSFPFGFCPVPAMEQSVGFDDMKMKEIKSHLPSPCIPSRLIRLIKWTIGEGALKAGRGFITSGDIIRCI